jgi:predicted HicB family RNase H-like nuclease
VPMARQRRYSELSPQHADEGRPTSLDVRVRANLKKRLVKIAERERRSLDNLVDLVLRDAAERIEKTPGGLIALLEDHQRDRA